MEVVEECDGDAFVKVMDALWVLDRSGGLDAATLATAALYLTMLSALLGFCARYAAQASRMAKFGTRALLGMDFPVMGLVS